MNYDAIKKELNRADRLCSEGNVAEADSLIRAMAGKGLTQNDLSSNLLPANLKKLRAYAKKARAK